MLNHRFPVLFLLLILPGLIGLAGCSLPFLGEDATPTVNVTQAYQTVNAKLTQSVAQTPSMTPNPSTALPSPTATFTSNGTPNTPAATSTRTPTQSLETPSPGCNLAAPGFPIDVTIPDGTQMVPGQPFTKTWRLQNAGNCTWTTDYSVALFSGESMGSSSSVLLPHEVAAGKSVDISVDMVAPLSAGTYQGNWKLRTASGQWFGIGPNGDSPFWVKIEVLSLPTESPTPTPPTPSITPTPGVQASGVVNLVPGDRLDLDSGRVNSGSGEDLSYEKVSEGVHQLIAQGTTLMGVFGGSQPSFSDCQAASPSATFLNVEALIPGTYLCYRTGLGLPGRALISNFDPLDATLTMEIFTWSVP